MAVAAVEPRAVSSDRCESASYEVAAPSSHELPMQAAGLQAPQKRGPERLVLAVADVEAEDLTTPVRGGAGRDHDRLGHDAVINSGLAVGRAEEQVAERLLGQAFMITANVPGRPAGVVRAATGRPTQS